MKRIRQRSLQDLLRQHGQMTVKELSERLEVSEATIRRDLQELSGAAGLERMHGGAALMEDVEPPVVTRRRKNAETKMALARRAAEEIQPDATVFIGSGSTTACLAECLSGRAELTVVTNASNVAHELASTPGISIIMTGGAFRKGEMSLIGPIAENTLRQVRFEVAFISVHGVSADAGLSNTFAPEAATDRVVVEMAPRLVVMAEAYKIGRVAPIPIGPASAADLLITDAEPDDAELARLVDAGVSVAHPHPAGNMV